MSYHVDNLSYSRSHFIFPTSPEGSRRKRLTTNGFCDVFYGKVRTSHHHLRNISIRQSKKKIIAAIYSQISVCMPNLLTVYRNHCLSTCINLIFSCLHNYKTTLVRRAGQNILDLNVRTLALLELNKLKLLGLDCVREGAAP